MQILDVPLILRLGTMGGLSRQSQTRTHFKYRQILLQRFTVQCADPVVVLHRLHGRAGSKPCIFSFWFLICLCCRNRLQRVEDRKRTGIELVLGMHTHCNARLHGRITFSRRHNQHTFGVVFKETSTDVEMGANRNIYFWLPLKLAYYELLFLNLLARRDRAKHALELALQCAGVIVCTCKLEEPLGAHFCHGADEL